MRSTRAHQPSASLRSRALRIVTVILCGGIAVSLFQATLSHVSLQNASYEMEGGSRTQFDLPLKVGSAPAGNAVITFDMHVGHLRPYYYYILPDDCLQELKVNDTVISSPDIPFCDFVQGKTFLLGPALNSGKNSITVTVRNDYGDLGFMLRPALSDIVYLLPFIVLLAAILCASFVGCVMLRPAAWITGTLSVLISASILRVYYMLITPHWIRGHDTDGHLEYITYIADHWTLPRPDLGWETWQPPLYYALSALWQILSNALGLQHASVTFGLQMFALMLSIASLFLFVWIGLRVLPKAALPFLPLFVALPAFLPSFVFQAARINNDVLVVFLELLAVALFFEWKKRRTLSLWIGTWVCVGLGILTKNTALLLLPPLLLALIIETPWRGWVTWKRKAILTVIALVTVGAIAGWFTVYRKLQVADQNIIIGNSGTLNSGLMVENSIKTLTTVNPIGMIRHPYNNPWSDEQRRQNFWEYWYRSAFFGEFDFGDARRYLASSMLFFSFLLFPVALFGFFTSLRPLLPSALPLMVLGGFLLLGHLLFRMQFPYASSQDFRYSLLVILPFAYFFIIGMTATRIPVVRWAMLFAAEMCLALCVLLLL